MYTLQLRPSLFVVLCENHNEALHVDMTCNCQGSLNVHTTRRSLKSRDVLPPRHKWVMACGHYIIASKQTLVLLLASLGKILICKANSVSNSVFEINYIYGLPIMMGNWKFFSVTLQCVHSFFCYDFNIHWFYFYRQIINVLTQHVYSDQVMYRFTFGFQCSPTNTRGAWGAINEPPFDKVNSELHQAYLLKQNESVIGCNEQDRIHNAPVDCKVSWLQTN